MPEKPNNNASWRPLSASSLLWQPVVALCVLCSFPVISGPIDARFPDRTRVETSQPELVLQIGHLDGVWDAVFSPDGRWLASGGGVHGKVRLWDMATGLELRTFVPIEKGTVEAWVESLAFHPNGRWLVVGHRDNTVTMWDVATGAEARKMGQHVGVVSRTTALFSPDGHWLVTGHKSGALKFWDVATWTVARTLVGHHDNIPGYDDQIHALAFTQDGHLLASTDIHHARLWDVASGSNLRTFEYGSSALALSPDGHFLAIDSAYANRAVDVWEVQTGKKLETLGGFTWDVWGIAFSPDGRWLAAGGGATVKLWEVATWREMFAASHHTDYIETVAFSPDGKLLISAGRDSVIHVWEVPTGRERFRMSGYAVAVNEVEFSPDGRWLALASRFNGLEPGDSSLRVFEASTGQLLHRFPVKKEYGPDDLRFSADSRTVSGQYSGQRNYFRRIWDVATGKGLESVETKDEGSPWDIKDDAVSPDGRLVVSASGEGRVLIRDRTTQEELAVLSAMRESRDWVIVTPDGLFDGSPEGMRKLVAWRFAGNQTGVLEMFFNEFYYPGLLAEILAGKRPKAPRDLAQLDRRQPEVKLTLSGGPQTGTVSTRRISVKLEVSEAPADPQRPSGSEARDVRLFRNGSLVKVWRGDVLAGQGGKATLEATIPIVAGENRLTAYAFNNDNIKSADAELDVTGAESLRRRGAAYILAIGVNEYENKDYNLSYALADAKAFAEELRQQQTKLATFADVQIIALHNQDATKANILHAILRLAGQETGPLPPAAPQALGKIKPAEPEDAVFIYYAGHGTAAGPRFYLIPHDLGYGGSRTELNEAGLKAILTHSISDQDLEEAFEKVDAGRMVLVIDACNSGQALEAEEKRRGPMNSKGLAQLAYEKGMYILTAAQGYQAALEAAQLGHGYLTYALVEEGLKTPVADVSPKDGRVVVREWLDYATLRVPQMQETMMQEARKLGRDVAFVEGEQTIKDLAKRSLQRPRVFYRREPETVPLVVAKPEANP